jgi:hypothetical protein
MMMEEEMAWYAGDNCGGSIFFGQQAVARVVRFISFLCMYAAVLPS